MNKYLLCDRHTSSRTCFLEIAGLIYSENKWLIGKDRGLASGNQEMQQNIEPGNARIPCLGEYTL